MKKGKIMLTLNTAKWSNAEPVILKRRATDIAESALQPGKVTSGAATCDEKKDPHPANGTYTYMSAPCLTQIDRVIIRQYFEENPGDLPSQTAPLAHRGQLSRIFPAHPLPPGLERKLSTLPVNYERVMIGRQVFLISSHTREISDVVHDIDSSIPHVHSDADAQSPS
jgi:hypothetical protein